MVMRCKVTKKITNMQIKNDGQKNIYTLYI